MASHLGCVASFVGLGLRLGLASQASRVYLRGVRIHMATDVASHVCSISLNRNYTGSLEKKMTPELTLELTPNYVHYYSCHDQHTQFTCSHFARSVDWQITCGH